MEPRKASLQSVRSKNVKSIHISPASPPHLLAFFLVFLQQPPLMVSASASGDPVTAKTDAIAGRTDSAREDAPGKASDA